MYKAIGTMYMRIDKRQFDYGFTLVEMLLAFAIVVIIFAAVVPQFGVIRRSFSANQASAAVVQNGRVFTEHINRNLSSASKIVEVSSASDDSGYIIFEDNSGQQKSYLISGGFLLFGNSGTEQQLAEGVNSFNIKCYSLDDFANETTEANDIRFIKVQAGFASTSDSSGEEIFGTQIFLQTNSQSAAGQCSVYDVFVKSLVPNEAFDYIAGYGGCDAVIDIDWWQSGGGYVHGLLGFKDIIGSSSGQIPSGTEITDATLKLWYVKQNYNSQVYIYRMTEQWDESSTWNSIGGGINSRNSTDKITTQFGSSAYTTIEINVSEIVRKWVSEPASYPNYGFGIINSSGTDLQFAASENTTGTGAHTPILEIRYCSFPADGAGVAVKNSVSCGGYSMVFDSYKSSLGDYGGDNVSESAVVAVNSSSTNSIVLYNSGTLKGNAYIGVGGDVSSGIQTYSGSEITGIQAVLPEAMSFPNPSAPSDIPEVDKWQRDLSSSTVITEDCHYRQVGLWGSSRVVIDGDVVMVVDKDFSIGYGASISLTSGSSLELYVGRTCDIGGELNAENDKKPLAMQVYMTGNNKTFNMYGGQVYILLDNPNGDVGIWNYTQFYGRMRCKSFGSNGGIHIDLDSSFNGITGGETETQVWTFGGSTAGSSSSEILP